MIVKFGNWAKNPLVKKLCDSLLRIPNSTKKSTPQRCHIQLAGKTLTSIGLEKSCPVVEFFPGKDNYAEAHGSRFVHPHPMTQMARDGWLQAHPCDEEEVEKVIEWVTASVSEEKKE